MKMNPLLQEGGFYLRPANELTDLRVENVTRFSCAWRARTQFASDDATKRKKNGIPKCRLFLRTVSEN